MDPIYYQVNQTRLTENTQRSSDHLRMQQNKEAKRKSEKAGEVDKSALATDLSSMSDDMLGDMDPDDFGGRGAQQFAQMWKEQLSEEEEPDPAGDPEEGEEPAGEEEDSAPEEDEEEEEAASESVSPPPQSPPPAPSAPSLETPPEASSQPAAPAVSQESPPVPPPGPPPASAPKATQPPLVVSPPPAQKKGIQSLLDFSSGFLIAEEAQWDLPTVEAEVAEVPESQEAPLDEDISILLERMVTGDPQQPAYRKLCQLLSRFGRNVLQFCSEHQTRVYLLPAGEGLQAHPLLSNSEQDLEGAVYLPQNRLCIVEDNCLSQAPYGFHPVFFYFAHAFDHALGGEHFASLKSPAVRASYEACLAGAHRFGDLMAAHSPAHYFAQAVESYLAENDCFEPLWSRQDLYDFDRSMHDYVEYLLQAKR